MLLWRLLVLYTKSPYSFVFVTHLYVAYTHHCEKVAIEDHFTLYISYVVIAARTPSQ